MKISFSQDETPWIFHVHVNLTQGSYSSWWLQTDLANRSSPRLIILNIVANYSSWWSTLPNGFLMEISWVMGVPPKSFILIGCSIINHLFWGIPISGNLHMTNGQPGQHANCKPWAVAPLRHTTNGSNYML